MANLSSIGKYLIRRELGKGAMGVVYEGFDPVLERTVAIKTILPDQLDSEHSVEVLARFKREAQAAGRLNHPGIVAVYDYGEVVAAPDDDSTLLAAPDAQAAGAGKVAYIAMEFVKGRELRDFFENDQRFTLREAGRLMEEILAALGHAHSKGVVHRDIKPANLIVLEDGSVKIADFGIARVEKSELTQAGTVMGTPSYMSPEQFMGQTVDARSDLFSCAIILYQFLTGEKPFTGTTTTIMFKVLREEPLAPSMLNVAVPSAFDAVVKKAMAKSPDERYQTAAEFVAAIRAAVVGGEHKAAASNPSTEATFIAAATLDGIAQVPLPAAAAAIAPIAPVTTVAAAPVFAQIPGARPAANKAMFGLVAGVLLAMAVGAGAYFAFGAGKGAQAPALAGAPGAGSGVAVPAPATALAPALAAAPAAPAAGVATAGSEVLAAAGDPPQEAGSIIVSALGLVDPKDPRFKGDVAAAQAEARADAKRQLVEKVLALNIEGGSLNKNYALIERKLLAQPGAFIKTVLREGAPTAGKDGLIETETRAVIKVREVQKSLNQLSKEERIDFIRNNGDPKVSIQMTLANADTALVMPPTRSQLAENVLKERIKSFGFRVWSVEGDAKTGPAGKVADFLVQGEAKVKLLSAKLPASGITVTKTVLTSWTVKAIDRASGEEIYLNSITPQGKSWASEDEALLDIGKLMGDEFSKGFFMQHFSFGVRRTNLNVTGLPNAHAARLLLRELRGLRQVLDVQMVNESGRYQLQIPEGNAADLVQNAFIGPLNTKLGQNCFALAGSSDAEVGVSFASACAEAANGGKLETMPPAGLLNAPDSRGKPLLKSAKTTT